MKYEIHRSQTARYHLTLLLAIFLLPVIACGMFNPQYYRNNEVRVAVFEYERETRGPVDDLVIDFERNEPRVKFEGQSENGGRTVWLHSLGAKEYFSLRSPESTCLYIQKIEYADNYRKAIVTLYRSDSNDFEGRELMLIQDGDEMWVVASDKPINQDNLRSGVGEE